MTSTPITYPLDREHTALRGVVLLTFFLGGGLAFVTAGALIADQGIDLLAVGIGVGVAFAGAFVVERLLKRIWPSGRVLVVDAGGVQMRRRETVESAVQVDQPVTALLWTFRITRRSRVPKGWSMVACSATSDDQQVTAYALMSPKQVAAWADYGRFVVLQPRKQQTQEASTGANPLRGYDALRADGQQRRLMEAEAERWLSGGEMTADDFIDYVRQLHARFPGWLPPL